MLLLFAYPRRVGAERWRSPWNILVVSSYQLAEIEDQMRYNTTIVVVTCWWWVKMMKRGESGRREVNKFREAKMRDHMRQSPPSHLSPIGILFIYLRQSQFSAKHSIVIPIVLSTSRIISMSSCCSWPPPTPNLQNHVPFSVMNKEEMGKK